MAKILELQLNAVNDWLRKETESTVKSLNSEAKNLLEAVQNRLDELFESSEKLLEDAEKEMARGSRKTFRRAKFLYKLAGSFSDLIDSVVVPDEFNGKTLGETSIQLNKAMTKINEEKNKWFRALAPYFILSRRRFETSLKRSEEPCQRFNSFFSEEYSKVVTIESIPPKIQELEQILLELNSYKTSKQERTLEKAILEKQIQETKQKILTLQSKSELFDLAQLNSKIDQLNVSVKSELRHLEKPLLKFQTMVNNPGYSIAPEANNKLDKYISDPFEALATEETGYPLLKLILEKIVSALDSKKMKLKPTRLRKAKDQINQIMKKDSLMALQIDCRQFFEQKRKLVSSGAISECKDEKVELQDCLKSLETKMRLLEAKDKRLGKEYEESITRVKEQKKELETIFASIVERPVKVTLD